MNNRVKQVLRLLNNLDEFAAGTELSRHWHARWQVLFQNVGADVQKILTPEKKKTPKTPDA